MILHRLAVLAVSALLLAPLAAAQGEDKSRDTTMVNFYGHVFAFGYDLPMPANTQFPYGEDNLGLGGGLYCGPGGLVDDGGDVPAVDPAGTCDQDPNTKLVLFSTAGPVDIGTRDEFFGGDTYVQFHNERGSTKDITLDTGKKMTATLFMSLDSHVWYVGVGSGVPGFQPTTTYCNYPNPPDSTCLVPYWGWDPMAHWPDWVVRARLYYAVFGDYGSGASERIPIREAVESGSAVLIGEGQVGPQAIQNGLPGAPNVHRFEVDLGNPKVKSIPKEANFFLLYDWYSETGGNKFATVTWRVWTGEFFPPTFVVPTKNAFDVELVAPVFLHGKLVILGVLNTPWGSYDVKPDATRLLVTDASGKEVIPKTMDVVNEYKFAHGAHYNPVNVSYIWNYGRDSLPPGTYTATVSGSNQQGTALASCAATFEILQGGRPGNVEVGRCGRSVRALDPGAAGAAPPAQPGRDERLRIAQALPYGLGQEYLAATGSVAPAPEPAPLAYAAPLAAAVALLGVALRRRWGS